MNAAELERYLHEHIPLSTAMQVAVAGADEESVVLRAPLAPNINHRATAFGGSVSALAILAAWSLVHLRLRAAGIGARLVIQRNSMDYDLPISGAFDARSFLAEPEKWDWFLRTLARKGRARIHVGATLLFAGKPAGEFAGEFVALDGPP